MIPETLNNEVEQSIEDFETYPSLTYRFDFVNKRIIGKVDDKDAVLQFIKKVLDTDKYAYVIYDWYYGNELIGLVAMPYEYIIVEAPRIVEEALLVDERIKSISNFSAKKLSVDSMEMSFRVHTIYGTLPYTLEVST